ncbi:DUF6461 domain-containing protein [Streptosporangium subroseum]|nr:DUF6461 domain-containing protein [Streptosporangium subroseum]
MNADAESHYQSLLGSGFLGDDMCITWCRGKSADEVARLFGGEPVDAELKTLDEAFDEASEADKDEDDDEAVRPPVILIGELGEWTVVLEPYGGQGVRPLVLQTLSEGGGRALSFKWTVNLDTIFFYAVNGLRIAGFDLLDPPARPGGDADEIEELVEDLPKSLESGLILAERITGQRLDSAWLSRRHRRMFMVNPIRHARPWLLEAAFGHPMLDSAELRPLVATAPTPDRLPFIIASALDIAMRENAPQDISDDPVVAEAMAALRDRPGAAECERLNGRLTEVAHRFRAQTTDGVRDPLARMDQFSTLNALAAAFIPDLATAAFQTVRAVRQLRWLDVETRLRLSVLAGCVHFIRKSTGAIS